MKSTSDKPHSANAAENPKVPFFQRKPQAAFEVSVADDGSTVSTPLRQSPFPLGVITSARQNPEILGLLQRSRAGDFVEHKSYVLERGPMIERQYHVSAREIFYRGDSKAAARLRAASESDYAWLKEYSLYL